MNKHVPHVLVLPEDDANRQLANGFVLDHCLDTRRIQILEEAGGWEPVLERFKKDHVQDMERNPNRFMVLLIDFDGHLDRFDRAKGEVPKTLQDRVFIVGVRSEPERLKADIRQSYEDIGAALAKDCRDDTDNTWSHPLLCHNTNEVQRLRASVKQILFPVLM